MKMKEIKASTMNVEKFIDDKIRDIRNAVGDGLAVNALSGGVDSCVVTALGHKALGSRLKTYMIDNGIMREGEPAKVAAAFKKLGITVEVIDASKAFFAALKGLTDPEEKREAITQTFYKNVFGKLVVKSKAQYLLQGTILTDVDETVAGIKRQHNVFEQLGIDPQKAFGYKILEPLIELRKDGVRKVGAGLGLPSTMFDRIPFPGPALAARVIGEVTPARVALVRNATAITEAALKGTKAFQYLAILHEDRVTGMRDGKRVFGNQIEIRSWDSTDARKAKPSRLSFDVLEKIAAKITKEIPEVVSVTYNITSKPTSTIEAI
ncbi:MAG: asparagine synthase-related protein [Smithellaceae bacterium]|nr:asparagine synthase-related protein [Smithellaceae bacterium]NLX53014.1 ExsB family transcriptional regulator [Deltaproteobacteria bacterium]